MIPRRIQGANRTLAAPLGWDKERDGTCAGLAVRVVGDAASGHIQGKSACEPTPARARDIERWRQRRADRCRRSAPCHADRRAVMRARSQLASRLLSRCRVCASSGDVAVFDPRGLCAFCRRDTYCPAHCPEHDFNYDRGLHALKINLCRACVRHRPPMHQADRVAMPGRMRPCGFDDPDIERRVVAAIHADLEANAFAIEAPGAAIGALQCVAARSSPDRLSSSSA
jgi:hypothetical protein